MMGDKDYWSNNRKYSAADSTNSREFYEEKISNHNEKYEDVKNWSDLASIIAFVRESDKSF